MPIYMDVHIVPGVKAIDVAEAHRKDILVAEEHGCKCMTYWIDEARENIFCLIEAPTKEDVETMHSKAHGLIPNRIIEVDSALVESFLGRIYDPEEAVITDDGLKVFCDPSFRILLVTSLADPALVQFQMGKEKANDLLNRHNESIRNNLAIYGGSEAEHDGMGFIASFSSAAKAVSCALAIQHDISSLKDAAALEFSIALNGGEPVAQSETLFGDTIRLAEYMCSIAKGQIAVASSVHELVSKNQFQSKSKNFLRLSPQDEQLLELLFKNLDVNWQNPDFDIEDYCQATTMSKSQLYRKTVAFTGLSPNLLLKDFRLQKAKEMMKKKRYSISQITFDSGFTSPSYFTKCFKKKYGLLPMAYLDLLH